MQVDNLLNSLGNFVEGELTTGVEIIDCDEFPSDYYLEARKWKRITDVVVVAADLADSTKLNFDKYVSTSASIYESATGGAVRCLTEFAPEFVDIQGDGMFALFHGHRRWERAFCAAVTVKTFSERELVPMVEKHLSPRTPTTGFKLGMAAGILAVKNVGVRGTSEPVWAGKPVNWSYKCAQAASAHQLIITERVWNKVKDNDYVRYSCGCRGGVSDLWSTVNVEKLPTEDWTCRLLRSAWCINCGETFCNAILDGKTDRDDVPWAA
jgi:class 3 adenylate cyclase